MNPSESAIKYSYLSKIYFYSIINSFMVSFFPCTSILTIFVCFKEQKCEALQNSSQGHDFGIANFPTETVSRLLTLKVSSNTCITFTFYWYCFLSTLVFYSLFISSKRVQKNILQVYIFPQRIEKYYC